MGLRLNIAIACYPTYGGSGVVATELGRHLARIGHSVHLISYDAPVRMPMHEPNIAFHAVTPKEYALFRQQPYTIGLAAKMVEVILSYDIDILHVHYAIPHAVSGFLARSIVADRHPVKLITTLHGTDITLVGSDPSYFEIVKFAIEQSDSVTAVSNSLLSETVERFGIEKDIKVIYNFVDPNDFAPSNEAAERYKMFAPNGESLLCHISNYRPVKRAVDVVEIFARVAAEVPSKLLMVGDGVDMPLVRARARELDLCDKVEFLGNRGDIAEILEVSKIFLIPSESESFGLAALEAMASGCAIVGTKAGGIPEVVTPACGILHEIGDVQGMAASCVKLLKDSRLLMELQTGAHDRALKHFDARTKVAEYLAEYHRVLGSQEPFGPEYASPSHLSD
ncbi:MAG: N-acetyl-alpha-D-glucosaminyl L-malate synthase BshA [bacterium]